MLRENIYKINDLYNTLKGEKSIYKTYSELKKMEHYDKDHIEKIIYEKMKKIIIHAEKNIPYYKGIFKINNIKVDSIRNIEDMRDIPILNKKIIRDHFPDRITDEKLMYRSRYNTTSGSTGEPLEFYLDRKSNPYVVSSFMFFNKLMGVAPFDIHWNLKSVGKYTMLQKLNYWVIGKHLYSVLDVKKENLPEIVRQIDTIKPRYLEGYSASLEKLARFIYEEEIKLKHKPKAIIATSETLTKPGRSLLEEVFESEVFDRYGSREFCGGLAQECKYHKGLHVNPLLSYIEVVDEEGERVSDGEEGRIIITDLNNMVMPFIRYEIGDIGVMGQEGCTCGLQFPLIESIQGRSGEFIVSSEDEQIPFITISAYLFRRHYAPYAYAYQFIQREKGEISLKIVPTEKFTEDIHRQIDETLSKLLPGFKTKLIIVDDIPLENDGKTPFLKKMY